MRYLISEANKLLGLDSVEISNAKSKENQVNFKK